MARTSDNELGESIIQSRSRARFEKYFGWVRLTSVEPTMWLYMMAYMTTSVVEQAFFVHKACRVDHGFSEEYCKNISANETRKSQVQLTVSNFHQWNNIAGHLVPIILALWIGNWSDRRGRKLPLIIGLCGKVIYSGMVVVNAMMPTWNLNMIIYTASIPMAMLGGDVAIFACCFSYISDVSSVAQRTLRVTILDVIYLSTMPTGIALGSYLFTKVFDSSYAILFAINTALLILAIIYSFFGLKWQTSPSQKPLTGVNVFTDFFDKKHLVSMFSTLTKFRPNRGRLHLWILFIAMSLYTFQRDEKPMSYLYTQRTFDWNVTTFSQFRTFQSSLFVVAMLVCGPLMSRVFGLKDTVIVAIGALSHATGRIFFAEAPNGSYFYAGAAVAGLGPIVAPVLRSMVSKVVPMEERGKVFAILSVCDTAVPLYSGVIYTQLYNATYYSLPAAIYWLTFATQITVICLIMTIHFSGVSNGKAKGEEEEEQNSETDELRTSLQIGPTSSITELSNDRIKEGIDA